MATEYTLSFSENPLYNPNSVSAYPQAPNVAGTYSGTINLIYSNNSSPYGPDAVTGNITVMGVTYDSAQGDEFEISSTFTPNVTSSVITTITITGQNIQTQNPDGSLDITYPKGVVVLKVVIPEYGPIINSFDSVVVEGPGTETITPTNQITDTRPTFVSTYTQYDNGLPSTVNNAPVTTSYNYICYVSGTEIRTIAGNVAVENLKAGNFVVTASGEARRIVWLGHRTLDCIGHPMPQKAWPYRVRAHAFGENLPARDLFLSPDHAVMVPLLSEVLIPIKHLDNGATITQVPVDEVTYWHVELESHDLLLAENLPAESFLDTLGRDFFERQGFEQDKASFTTKAGRPHLKNWQTDACRPLVTEGAIVAAAREMLLARAQELGWTKTQEADLHVLADGARIEGRRLSGTTIRFTFPAATQDLELASRSFVPRHGDVATLDERRLGVPVVSLVLRQRRAGLADLAVRLGLGASGDSTIALDGPGLIAGFHPTQEWEGERWRWTNGAARLSAALWAGLIGALTLDVELASERGIAQVWQAPADVPQKRAA